MLSHLFPGSSPAPAMVGRRTQLRELEERWRLARGGAGGVVFVCGEAGVGKSRLLRELVRRIGASSDTQVLEGRCYDEDPAVPYGPFLEALRSLVRAHGAGALARADDAAAALAKLLPELEVPAREARSAPDASGEKRRLFEAIHHAVRPPDPATCRVLVLEDLHWSDPTSLEALLYLARAAAHERLLVIATRRTGEAGQRRGPLAHAVDQLTRERLYHEVRLFPLGRDEVASMLGATLDEAVPARLAEVVHAHTDGNPFFVEEVLRALLDAGQLGGLVTRAREGLRIDRLAVPGSCTESILARAADLDPDTADTLRYAAVIGRRFDFALLHGLTGRGEPELLRSLEQLVAHGFVVEERGGPDDRYGFRHALTREAVYEGLLGRERRRRHREVLRALEEMGGAAPDDAVDQLAYHALQAGDTERAAKYARLAGDRAARMLAYREAIAHYEAALEVTPAACTRERAALLERLAEMARPLGDSDASSRFYRQAQELYERLGDRRRAGDILRSLGEVAWQTGDPRTALAHVRGAVEILEDEEHGRELAMAYGELAALCLLSSAPRESAAWGERALRLAERLGDDGVASYALNWLGCARVELNEPLPGVALLERGLELAKRAGMADHAIRAYANLGANLRSLGDFRRAAAVLEEGSRFADRAGWESGRGRLTGALGNVLMELGDWPRAHELLDREIRPGATGYPAARLSAVPWKGELLLREGRRRQARELLESVVGPCERQAEGRNLRVLYPILARARWVLGDTEGALAALARCAALLACGEPSPSDADMLGYPVELFLGLGQPEQAEAFADALASVARAAPTPLVCAQHADALALLAMSRGDARAAAERSECAVELWREMGLPFQEARSRRRRADALHSLGSRGAGEEARDELLRACEILQGLGAPIELDVLAGLAARMGVTLPGLTAAPPAPPRAIPAPGTEALTPRELEILRKVAAGLSNRDIAREGFVSVGTVKTHIHHILAKLGVPSRTRAVARARELGILP